MLVIWRALARQKCGPAMALWAEAPFCLAFLFLFQQWKKKEEKRRMIDVFKTYINDGYKERRCLQHDDC